MLKVIESKVIGFLFGNEVYKIILKVCIIGLILVFLFMIIFYRLLGFIVDIVLVVYVVIFVVIVGYVKIMLIFFGIVGIVLLVVMVVDVNILIFVRLKEEFRNGKILRVVMDVGFRRVFNVVIDFNVIIIIVGIVFLFLGIGFVKGFVWMFIIGIVVLFFIVIIVIRFLFILIINIGLFKDIRWYGGKKIREVDV